MSLEKTFKALGDVNRREILKLLRKRRMNVGEIAEKFEMSAATLSYHLSLLKEAGLVFEEREKNYRIYSLNASVFEEVLSFFYDFMGEKKEKKENENEEE